MRGRKPKPTKLKILNGNPGKRPLNNAEAKFDGIAKCPDWLSDVAKEEWKRIAPALAKLGMASKADQAALTGYCAAWSIFKAAYIQVEEEGSSIDGATGAQVENPAVRTMDKALAKVLSFCSEFGMTPSSRSRMQVPGMGTDDTDPMEKILNGRRSG